MLLKDSLSVLRETPDIPPAFCEHMLENLTQAYEISRAMDSLLVPTTQYTQPAVEMTGLKFDEPVPFVNKFGKWDWSIPVSVTERMDQDDRTIFEDMEAGKFELLLYVILCINHVDRCLLTARVSGNPCAPPICRP